MQNKPDLVEVKPGSVHEPEAEAEADSKDDFVNVETTTIGDEDEAPIAQVRKSSVAPSQRLSVASNSHLDTVSLDDDTSAKSKGRWFC